MSQFYNAFLPLLRDHLYSKTIQVSLLYSEVSVADPGELGSLGSKEPSFCSLNNRKMGVVWLKVGVFQGKLMKRTPLVRVLDPPLTGLDSKHVYYNLI